MKESINIKVDAVQKKKLIEEAHKRNLTLKEYLRLLAFNGLLILLMLFHIYNRR